MVNKYYNNLVDGYNKIRKPTGEKEWPARTCRDLSTDRPELENGVYYIDPNEGDVSDAIQAFCNMETKETCIYPSPASFKRQHRPSAKSGYSWLSEMGEIVSTLLYYKC